MSAQRLLIPWIAMLAAGGLLGCEAAQQPPQCEAFLSCFYPGDAGVPEQSVEPAPDVQREEAVEAFGMDGECWRNGADDEFYRICVNTCAAVIRDECALEQAGEDRVCVRAVGIGANEKLVFHPPDWGEGRLADAVDCRPPE